MDKDRELVEHDPEWCPVHHVEDSCAVKRRVFHSCCPGKTNINAPEFKLNHTYYLPKANLEEWVCTGCKAVIQIGDVKPSDK
jgi:hypothetical protein